MSITYSWRGEFEDREAEGLHAEAFRHPPVHDDWNRIVEQHSLGWVIARRGGELLGFVNVPWDGFAHAWIKDLMVVRVARRQGIGTNLVAAARDEARSVDVKWLHVDFDDHLGSFYIEACGFTPTGAGLIALR